MNSSNKPGTPNGMKEAMRLVCIPGGTCATFLHRKNLKSLGLRGWRAFAGRVGSRRDRTFRLAEGAEDGQAEAEEGDSAHDEVPDACVLHLLQVVLLKFAQRLHGNVPKAFDFISRQPRFLGFAKRCLEFALHSQRAEALAGGPAQFHGDEPAFIVEKNHRTNDVFDPSVGVILGHFVKAVELFRGRDFERRHGDYIDMHVERSRGHQSRAETRKGFREQHFGEIEDLSGGRWRDEFAGRPSRGGAWGFGRRVVRGCGRGEEQAERGGEKREEFHGRRMCPRRAELPITNTGLIPPVTARN